MQISKPIEDSNDGKYIGEIQNGKRNGKGIMNYTDGEKYDG